MSEVIVVNLIRFKAGQFFIRQENGVRLIDALMKIGIADTEPPVMLLNIKRIIDNIRKEARLLDEAIKDIREPYLVEVDGRREVPVGDAQAMKRLNDTINELLETEIVIPFAKIKFTQITGIKSVAELDALDGIIEIDEV